MKKIIFSIIITTFSFVAVSAQQKGMQMRNASPEQRRELISKLSPEERKNMLNQFKENMLVEDLNIAEDKREDFKQLFNEYQDSQREIKCQFKNDFDAEKLSDEEAKQKLEQSFNVGQKLLDNRRLYAEKMQTVLKPQQVLRMFQNEGMMRDRMMNRKMEMNQNAGQGNFRAMPPQNGRNGMNHGMRMKQNTTP